MCENTLDVLNCDTVVSEDGVTKTEDVRLLHLSPVKCCVVSQEYLASEPEEVCWKKGEMQHQLVPLAALFVAIYIVGYPVLVALMTLNPVVQDLILDDQLLKMQHQGGWDEGLTPHLQRVDRSANVVVTEQSNYSSWLRWLFVDRDSACFTSGSNRMSHFGL